ncbi:DUF3891 family protein [Paenibacillus eucommiae]|uniref:DUF3891 family protein n=1 Tax=Paenibacillus eucommiae TaxID=1355755 RepID=A0ABS4IP51_9BACL|nr:DUF3891 family protein [Paenibacillus eucommiae]MBP1989329.1 hypothetical protein [Paenibacillus eucommiae]
MIVRETEHDFVLYQQHDHAFLSGEAASNLKEQLFINDSYVQDVLFAIYEHDRSWIRLDETPVWNDHIRAPFSFTDYPFLPKLTLYSYGLDETESRNEYAALLCSLYYSSFQPIRDSKQVEAVSFYDQELARQQRIMKKLNLSEELVKKHFKLLQICDEISLYVCMNEEGASKENEHPWYKDGLKTIVDDQAIAANWLNTETIRLTPFLFKKEFTASIRLKRVPKQLILQLGIALAYSQTPFSEQEVHFVK